MDIEIPDKLKLYEEHPETDAYFFHGQGQSVILTLRQISACIPGDAHKTCGMIEIPQKFIKAVYKIRL